jgi:hypothetical protein
MGLGKVPLETLMTILFFFGFFLLWFTWKHFSCPLCSAITPGRCIIPVDVWHVSFVNFASFYFSA